MFKNILVFKWGRKMKIINVTWHNIDILTSEGEIITIPPSDIRIVLSEDLKDLWYIEYNWKKIEVKIKKFKWNEVIEKLLPKKEGVIYLVSSVVAMLAPDRDDFYIIWWKILSPDRKTVIAAKYLSPNPYYRW